MSLNTKPNFSFCRTIFFTVFLRSCLSLCALKLSGLIHFAKQHFYCVIKIMSCTFLIINSKLSPSICSRVIALLQVPEVRRGLRHHPLPQLRLPLLLRPHPWCHPGRLVPGQVPDHLLPLPHLHPRRTRPHTRSRRRYHWWKSGNRWNAGSVIHLIYSSFKC